MLSVLQRFPLCAFRYQATVLGCGSLSSRTGSSAFRSQPSLSVFAFSSWSCAQSAASQPHRILSPRLARPDVPHLRLSLGCQHEASSKSGLLCVKMRRRRGGARGKNGILSFIEAYLTYIGLGFSGCAWLPRHVFLERVHIPRT